MASNLRVLVDGLKFPESPRWRDGKLWMADQHSRQVLTLAGDEIESRVDVPGRPSGLGFDAEGALLIASVLDGTILRHDGGQFQAVADLSGLATGTNDLIINDMVVDDRGNAYVDVYGVDGIADNGGIGLVRPGSEPEIVADGLAYPNGMVVLPGGNVLVVAETHSSRLTAFDIADDGRLADKRLWAEIPGASPDGICLDSEGAIWVGSAFTEHFYRVAEGGEILDAIHVPGKLTVACALGGESGTTLFLMTVVATLPELRMGISSGFVECAEVDVAGVEWL